MLVALSLSAGGDMVDGAQEVSPRPPVVTVPLGGVHGGGGSSPVRKWRRGVV
jgi:hypothetical protein